MNIKRRTHSAVKANTRPILAADDDEDIADQEFDEFGGPGRYDDGEGVEDSLDDVADTLDDVADTLDEIDEDEVGIEIENNISNHFIAECDGCQGIFISAVIESDQEIDHISGICPLCNKKTDQYLKWVIKDVEESDEVEEVEGEVEEEL